MQAGRRAPAAGPSRAVSAMERDAGANPLSPAMSRLLKTDSFSGGASDSETATKCHTAIRKHTPVSPLCKPSYCDSLRFVPGELRLAEGTHTSLNQTVEMLSSRIRYLEDLVESYRKELAGVTDLKISLRVKEIECSDLVRFLLLGSKYSSRLYSF